MSGHEENRDAENNSILRGIIPSDSIVPAKAGSVHRYFRLSDGEAMEGTVNEAELNAILADRHQRAGDFEIAPRHWIQVQHVDGQTWLNLDHVILIQS